MKRLFLLLLTSTLLVSCEIMPTEKEAYIMTKQLLEEELKFTVNEIDFPFGEDYRFKVSKDSTFMIGSYFTYKNAFNVEQKFNYISKVKYNGGNWRERKNWKLISVEKSIHY